MPGCVARLCDRSSSPLQWAALISFAMSSSSLAEPTLDVATWFLAFSLLHASARQICTGLQTCIV